MGGGGGEVSRHMPLLNINMYCIDMWGSLY